MRIDVGLTGVAAIMRDLEGDLASAATGAMREAMPHARQELREQVTGAGLGTRLANTWRGEVYPGSRKSINPSGYIWSNAPDIVDAFDRGAQITPKGGKRFLAIPTERVPRSPGQGRRTSTKRMTPAELEKSLGQKLFYRPGKAGRLLAFINAVASSGRSGYRRASAARLKQGRQLKPILMFVLVPSVRLPKLLNMEAVAARWAGDYERLFTQRLARS